VTQLLTVRWMSSAFIATQSGCSVHMCKPATGAERKVIVQPVVAGIAITF
jgi:hypothetical protein